MKNRFTVVVSAFVSLLFISWLNLKHYASTPQPITSLYSGDPDDPTGASAYDYYRFRNPATGELPKDIRRKELEFASHLPKHNDASRSIQWQNRGPYNLGGRTRALAFDVTNENIILAGQVTGGMWRSEDQGAHFTQTTQPQQLHSTTCVTQDKRTGHTNTWYYGTGEQYAVVNAAGFSSQFAGDGIFKSTDGGHSWAQLQSTVTGTVPNPLYQNRNFDFVWNIITDPNNTAQDVVYAAVVNGIWRSTDGGNSWTSVLGLDSTNPNVSQYSAIAMAPSGVLYATLSSESGNGGFYRSTDGINWVKITPQAFTSTYRRIEIGIAPGDENQVYFIAETPGTGFTGHSLWKYHYLSGDGTGTGGVWTNRTPNIPKDHCLGYYDFDFRKYNSQNSYDMYIVVHPTDTNLIYLGGTDIYRNNDGFSTAAYDWIGGYQCDSSHLSNYVYPGHHPDQHKLIFLPSNNKVAFSGTDGGIMKTNDITAPVVQWQLMNNGYNTGQFYTCAIEPGNTNSQMIIGGLQDNGSYFTNTIDYTRDWPKVFYGDGAYCAITHNRTNYYMSFQQGRVFKMTVDDNGAVTGLSRIDPTGGGNGYAFIAPFILHPLDDNVMYLTTGHIIWRNDSLNAIPIIGNETTTISQGWTKLNYTYTGSPSISAFSISEANPERLFFGTDGGKVFRLDSCKSSTTSVKVDISGSNFPANAYVSSVQADRLDADKILVTFSNYGVKSIFYTTNGGQSWMNISGNLEEHYDGSGNGPSVTWGHMYNDGNTTKFFAGTSTGLYSTETLNDSNTVWSQEGANTIGNVVINMIQSRPYDSTIVVATHGNGMYSNKIFTPSAINETKPDQLVVNCYPNPFSNNITIDLGTELKSKIEAEIFDASGRLVKKLSQQATNRIVWDGTDFSTNNCIAGIYLVRITADGRSALKKLVKL